MKIHIARLAVNAYCPCCNAGFVLESTQDGKLLLCRGCGKVFMQPAIELREAGDMIPPSHLPSDNSKLVEVRLQH